MKTLKTLFLLALTFTTAVSSSAHATGDKNQPEKKDTTAAPAPHTMQVYNLAGTLLQETRDTTELMPETLFLFSYEDVDYYMLDEKPAYEGTLKPVNL